MTAILIASKLEEYYPADLAKVRTISKNYKKIIFGVSYKNNFFPPVGAPDLRQLHREADPQDGEGSAGGPQF